MAIGRKPTAAELAELSGGDAPAGAATGMGRAPTADELAELTGPRVGPYRDAPSFSTAPAPTPVSVPPALDPAAPPAPSSPAQHSQGEAVLTGLASGATLGYDDEASGALSALAKRLPMTDNPEFGGVPGSLPEAEAQRAQQTPQTFGEDYRQGRDAARAEKADVRKEYPKTVLAGEIAGGLATGGAGAGRGAVANIARGLGTGAAIGAGNSDADLTRGQVGQFVKDTAVGSAVGGTVAGAGELVKGGVSFIRNLVTNDLKRRVLNEVAEGTANVSQTERKRLQRAADGILTEVTTGPDSKAVRAAYSGGRAQAGLEKLRPIVDRIGQENEAAYSTFERAGKGAVDVADYLQRLNAVAKDALKAGNSRLAKGVEAFRDNIVDVAKQTGGLKLTQLRALTTEAQATAANALGSLLERQNAKTARQVQGVVTEAMGQTMDAAAKDSPGLQEIATVVRENNARLHALLTLNEALEVRARKESSLPGVLVRGAKALTAPGLGSLVGAQTAHGDDDKAQRMILGAAAGLGAVPLARLAERGLTTMGIKAAQAGGAAAPGWGVAQRMGGLIGRLGAAASVGGPAEDADEPAPRQPITPAQKFMGSYADEQEKKRRGAHP